MKKMHLNTTLIVQLSDVLRMPNSTIASAAHFPTTTWYRIRINPNIITVQQLLALSNGMKIPVSRFFSENDGADYIGKMYEYVLEGEYQECYYDSDSVRKMMGRSSTLTWKSASEAVKVHWIHTQHSLLATTRLPVTRLLDFCHAFHLDPFQFLVDPNREVRTKTDGRPLAPSSPKEIETLRREMAHIRSQLSALSDRYDTLLDAHKKLADRLGEYREKVAEPVCAAEPEEEYGKKK